MVVKDENRWIKMEARTTNCQLYKIYGWVRREKKAAQKLNDENGDVPIKNEETGEVLNLIKDTDKLTPIPHGILVSVIKELRVCLYERRDGTFNGTGRCPGSRHVYVSIVFWYTVNMKAGRFSPVSASRDPDFSNRPDPDLSGTIFAIKMLHPALPGTILCCHCAI